MSKGACSEDELREVDALVCHIAHGWEWHLQTKDRGLHSLIPPENTQWERTNWYAPNWLKVDYWPAEDERYTDWHRGGSSRPYPGTITFLPKPSTSRADALEALMTFNDVGWDKDGKSNDLTIYKPYSGVANSISKSGKHEDFCIAACQAILKSAL